MELIKWSSLYSVSNTLIDDQHKQLVALINKAFVAITKRNDKEVISAIIDEIADYTVYHFNTEEELIGKFGYPTLENHQIEHKKFVEQVLKFKEDIKLEKLQLKFDVFSFLKDWLMNHIVVSDKKYMKYFKNKKIKEFFK